MPLANDGRDSIPAAKNRDFLTTRWSRVFRLSGNDEQAAREALAGLCADCWRPLYHFARRRGHSPHDSQDLTQGFLLALLETDSLARADPARGRFRSFLLGAFANFLAKHHRANATLKRGGGTSLLSLDESEAETFHLTLAADEATPEKAYERAWGIALLSRAMEKLRLRYETAGRSEVFEALQPYLSASQGRPGYARIGEKLGMSESAVTAAVHRMRRSFGTFVREEIAATVSDPADIDDELRHLMRILSGPGA